MARVVLYIAHIPVIAVYIQYIYSDIYIYPVYPYIRPPKRVFLSCAFVCSTNYDYKCVNLNRMAVTKNTNGKKIIIYN